MFGGHIALSPKKIKLFYDHDLSLVRVTAGDALDLVDTYYAYEASDTPWMTKPQGRRQGRAKKKNVVTKEVQTADKVVFPLKLTKTTRVVIPKPNKGKADEVLVLQNVFVNDDDDDAERTNRPEYAGTFGQLAQNHAHSKNENKNKNKISESSGCNLNFGLQELYQNIDIDDEDTSVVVTLYPIYNGQDVTIGGIKIVQADRP